MPEAVQASALEWTLRAVNEAANRVSEIAFAHGVPREYELRKHTYAELKAQGLGAQAAQHTIKKVRDAYTTLKANIRAGNLGKEGSKRRRKAESKPLVFRPESAQPYDDRCLSWQYDQRTVSIWTVSGRVKNVRFVCSANALKTLQAHRQGESDLIERDGVFYLLATCEVPEAEQYEPDGFIGVDLGIANIATTSTGYMAAGRGLNRHRKRQLHLRKKLQKKRTKSAKRAGVPLVFVDPAYTSQMCAECRPIDKRNRLDQGLFMCRGCGVVAHADRNASHNIATRGESVWNAGRESRVPATP